MVKIRIIYDNTTTSKALIADWGFAALVEAHGRTLLFDTGGNGPILMDNMKALAIRPESITDVFISHCHFDHIGGLSHFLEANPDVTIYAPVSFRGVKHAKKVQYCEKPQELFPHFYTTGELEGIEQSLAVETDKGLLIIVGCSHPDMATILEKIRLFGDIYGIVGGLHGFDRYDLFQDMQLICPTHCTQHIGEIKSSFPDQYVQGGTGKIIEIASCCTK